ncbi:hypothetical protein [Nocardia sp. NPDC052566]|uniref:hypothetical protein n=1 Tax=Nocardia sp. NPDC052566 TaxID=3364330 RepID=UPI0037C51EA9
MATLNDLASDGTSTILTTGQLTAPLRVDSYAANLPRGMTIPALPLEYQLKPAPEPQRIELRRHPLGRPS